MADSPWIIETTTEKFEADVLERSLQAPVVVDFWARWCGPCRQLAPVLEKLADEFRGRFVLVKVNVDECQEIAAAVGIQSIPLVLAFRDKQVVNQFMGALPEPQLREWLQTILPSAAEEHVRQGRAVESSDPITAESHYRQALELEPHSDPIRIHLARVLVAQTKDDEARELIAHLEKRGFLEPEAESLKAQLDLRAGAAEAGGVTAARKAVEANPSDPSLKIKLADALAVGGKWEEAMQICLELVQQDKAGAGVQAKETLVKIFETPGAPPHLVSDYRRKLATALY